MEVTYHAVRVPNTNTSTETFCLLHEEVSVLSYLSPWPKMPSALLQIPPVFQNLIEVPPSPEVFLAYSGSLESLSPLNPTSLLVLQISL